MNIRKCSIEDSLILEGLFSILYKPEPTWSEEKIKQDIQENKKLYFLALEEGIVTGAFGIKFEEKAAKFGPIAIKKEYQRKGIGSELLKFAEKLTKEKDLAKIYCYSLELYKASGFYTSNGWKEEKYMRKFFDGQDCYIFSKEL